MARSGRRHDDGKGGDVDGWARWQFVATVIRVVIEIIDLFDHGAGGPGRLP